MKEQNQTTDLVIQNGEVIGMLQIDKMNPTQFELIEELKPKMNVTPTYITVDDWKENPTLKGFYMGLDQIPNEDGEAVDVAIILGKQYDKKGKAIGTEPTVFLLGQFIAVAALKRLPISSPEKPMVVNIIHKGDKPARKGKIQLFNVMLCK